MKIVFMGTPDFSVPSLKRLIEEFEVAAVFTQPDKPKNRGKKLTMSSVKEVALNNNIPVYQPIKIKNEPEFIEKIKEIDPDFIVVVAYGQILPKALIDIPKFGTINLHASLLPKYRGPAPLNWVIINGEKKSGNTIMLIDVGCDTGDMLLKSEVDIDDNMTYGELHDILMTDGAGLLVKTMKLMAEGKIQGIKQDHSLSSYAPALDKEICKINWGKTSKEIKNLIRGLNPKPTAFTFYKNETMKVYEAEVIDEKTTKEPGVIIDAAKAGIKVATGDGVLLLKKIQFPGGKPLMVHEYIKGHSLEIGVKLA